ncbi:polysaccharide deacetylase family protein [Streptomyces sp. URMC 126]|uniref:polysaccharide deacetylase family protein n=1 Tax=Streptomyces sp. URMC 126 TaxID=3423401 RepID=UPI003F1AD2AB
MSGRRRAPLPLLLALLLLTVLTVLVGPGGSAAAQGAGRHRLPPVLSHIPTRDRVVFLTIDDGWYRDPAAAALLRDRRVPVTLFPLPDAVNQDPGYFRELAGRRASAVGNHTVGHPDLTTLGLADQRKEICTARDRLKAAFGRAPALLRPPFGRYDDTTRTAARECGVRALVTWTHDFTTWGDTPPPVPRLRPGDVVLLHFTPTLAADLTRALTAARDAGLVPAPLRAYAP